MNNIKIKTLTETSWGDLHREIEKFYRENPTMEVFSTTHAIDDSYRHYFTISYKS